jgi:hypothetical protein
MVYYYDNGEMYIALLQFQRLVIPLLYEQASISNTSVPSFLQGPHDKSKRVFAIFRQWQVSSPSQ